MFHRIINNIRPGIRKFTNLNNNSNSKNIEECFKSIHFTLTILGVNACMINYFLLKKLK